MLSRLSMRLSPCDWKPCVVCGVSLVTRYRFCLDSVTFSDGMDSLGKQPGNGR
jgi:hypothetical protein